MNHNIKIEVNGNEVETLSDILPENKKLDILFIAKTPALLALLLVITFKEHKDECFGIS